MLAYVPYNGWMGVALLCLIRVFLLISFSIYMYGQVLRARTCGHKSNAPIVVRRLRLMDCNKQTKQTMNDEIGLFYSTKSCIVVAILVDTEN